MRGPVRVTQRVIIETQKDEGAPLVDEEEEIARERKGIAFWSARDLRCLLDSGVC